MLLKSMSRERGRSPPSPGEPVMVKVLPLPVTPYVNSRPMNIEYNKYITTFQRGLELMSVIYDIHCKTGMKQLPVIRLQILIIIETIFNYSAYLQ